MANKDASEGRHGIQRETRHVPVSTVAGIRELDVHRRCGNGPRSTQITTEFDGLARSSRWRWCSRSTPAARVSASSWPDVQVALGQSVPVTTIGAIETFTGPNSVPHRPTTWQCVHLHGTAEEVIVDAGRSGR